MELQKELKELAVQAYKLNEIKKAADRDYKKAIKNLSSKLDEEGISEAATFEYEGSKTLREGTYSVSMPSHITVETTSGNATSIDIKKLKEITSEETFMSIVSATLSNCKKFLGTSDIDSVSISGKTAPTLKVKSAS